MKEQFHPNDHSSRAMFARSHDKLADMLRTFVEIQQGPNPLSRADLERLVAKHPRYAVLLGGKS